MWFIDLDSKTCQNNYNYVFCVLTHTKQPQPKRVFVEYYKLPFKHSFDYICLLNRQHHQHTLDPTMSVYPFWYATNNCLPLSVVFLLYGMDAETAHTAKRFCYYK